MPRVLVPVAALLACSVIVPMALVVPFPGPHTPTSSPWIDHFHQPSALQTAQSAAAATVTR